METRAIDLPTALLVATAALCCSVVVGCAFVLLVAVADGKALPASDDWAAWSAAAGVACAGVATLIALTRSLGGLWPSARAAASFAVAALALMTVGFAAAPDGAEYAPHAAAVESSWPSRDYGLPSSGSGDAPPAAAARRRSSPARAVRAYYRALDRRDFRRAWRSLSPAVRAGFGGFAQWRAGFGATLSSAPGELRVAVAGDDAAVDHVLTARDRAACGVLVQRFDVRWRLHRTAGAWQAVALSAGQRPGARCLTS